LNVNGASTKSDRALIVPLAVQAIKQSSNQAIKQSSNQAINEETHLPNWLGKQIYTNNKDLWEPTV
jgi:hypothetical protein